MNERINIEEIKLLHLIHFHGSITKAAELANMSQSNLSKKLVMIEEQLQVQLFVRTTRSLTITEKGLKFLENTASIPKIIDNAINNLKATSNDSSHHVRLDISTSLSTAHLPGFIRKQSLLENTKLKISHHTQKTIIKNLQTQQTDIAILPHTHELDKIATIHKQIDDSFTLIINKSNLPPSMSHLQQWSKQQSWILPSSNDITHYQILSWLRQLDINCEPTMEIPNFDMINHLVALDHGVAIVPKRSISLFYNKKLLKAINLPKPLSRKIDIVSPIQSSSQNVTTYLDSVLFS